MGEVHEKCDNLLIPIYATVDKSVIKVKSTQGPNLLTLLTLKLLIKRNLMDNRKGGNIFLKKQRKIH